MPFSAWVPTRGRSRRNVSMRRCRRMYTGFRRIVVRLLESLETVGAQERPLSLSTMITLRSLWPRLLSASYAMPPVSEPSPMTATMCAPVRIHPAVARHGEAVGVGEDRRGVAVLDEVVLRLLARGVAGQPAGLAELGEAGRAAGDDLVNVRLVPGVPEDGVARRVEHPVQGQGELDGTEVRPQVPAVLGHGGDDEVADLARQLLELVWSQGPEVLRLVDGLEQHGCPTLPPRCGRYSVGASSSPGRTGVRP